MGGVRPARIRPAQSERAKGPATVGAALDPADRRLSAVGLSAVATPPANSPPDYPGRADYGPPGYQDAQGYGGPSYPPPPPQYGQSYPPPSYGSGYGGPPGYPGPYDPYHPYRDRSHETNGLAIGSLVTSVAGGLLGIPLSFVCYIGILIPIVGAVLGVVALSQIKRTNQQGRGLAIAGIAIGATAAVLLVLLVLGVMAATHSPSVTPSLT